MPIEPATAALLDALGVATLLHLSVRKIRTLNTTGQMPLPIRLGRCVRWRLSEIHAWTDSKPG
jgi:predicted DNA-binding transcriptional regulator AlpA